MEADNVVMAIIEDAFIVVLLKKKHKAFCCQDYRKHWAKV
tara:strand:- start:1002 stop:1121 length:120 start_codon:yes stop_codon:yes gene_type:complete